MKKFFKWIGIIIGAIVVILGGIAAYIGLSDIPSYDVKKVELTVVSTPERVARGKKIGDMLCSSCHLDYSTGKLSGAMLMDSTSEFGIVWSRNITQHPEKGIGKWTDGEIAWMLRTGISPKTGKFAPPWMPKLVHLSDEDLASVIAWLRSDDPRLQPADVASHEPKPTFLTKVLCRFVFKPYDYPTKPIPPPDTSNKVALGRYYVFSLDCFGCHSADFKSFNPMEPEKSGGYLGGGNLMEDATGRKVYAPNITPDKETGIGNWTEDQFVRAIRDGFRPDGSLLRTPMARYFELEDNEIRAIYAYLRTVPVLHNPRKAGDSLPPMTNASAGKKSYYHYGCSGCHGDYGVGMGDLRQAYKKYPTDSALVSWIKHPELIKPGTKMPTWDGIIKEEDFPGLCAFVRELGQNAAGMSTK